MELERLREWLKEKSLSYGDLAIAVNLDYNYTCTILRGERPIGDKFRWRFSRAYGVEAAEEVFGFDAIPKAQLPLPTIA
jgi:transcriptional regulator with XRE-family HTH domain